MDRRGPFAVRNRYAKLSTAFHGHRGMQVSRHNAKVRPEMWQAEKNRTLSGEHRKFRWWYGWGVVTIGQALEGGCCNVLFGEQGNVRAEVIGELFPVVVPEAGLRIAATGATAGQNFCAGLLLIPAAIGYVVRGLFALQFPLPAAAGMIGSPFRRAAADVAIADALSGNGMRHQRRSLGERRKGAHDAYRIDCDENQGYDETPKSFHKCPTRPIGRDCGVLRICFPRG